MTDLVQPQGTMTFETITPDLARELLKLNTNNRAPTDRRVDALARDIRNGVFVENGDTIRLNGDQLYDGQKRLLACIKADTPFSTWMYRGIQDRRVHRTIDVGQPRSPSQELSWAGETSSALLAAMLALVWRYDNNAFFDTNRMPTRSELYAVLEQYPYIRESTAVGSTTCSKIKIPSSVCGGCHFLFRRETTLDEASAFWFLVRTEGAAIVDSGPFLLRRYALRVKLERAKRPTQVEWTALTIKAFNSWMEGATARHLRWRRGGSKAEGFPEIVPQAYVGESELPDEDD